MNNPPPVATHSSRAHVRPPCRSYPVWAFDLLLAVGLVAGCGEASPPVQGSVDDGATLDVQSSDAVCADGASCPVKANPCTVTVCTSAGCVQQDLADGSPCSDGEPCTEPDGCLAGVCTPGPERCACRDDERCQLLLGDDKCLGTPWCDKTAVPHVCRRKLDAPACDPSKDTVCAEQRCDVKTGKCAMTPVNNGGACSDGNPCTADDACVAGLCFGPTPSCQCELDVDCPDDGNPCTGKRYCDTTGTNAEGKPTKVCKVNLSTVIKCVAKDVGPCKVFACDPKDGACKVMPVPDGVACEDGDPCSTGDVCAAGSCKAGVDVCTCAKQSDCASLEDGDLCNGVLYCDAASAKCKVNPKTVVTCSGADDTACVKNLCHAKTGTCAPTPVLPGTPCSDGDLCTIDEICVAGGCSHGTNVCACATDKDCADKDDGNRCNGTIFCNQQTKLCIQNPGAEVVCATGEDTACVKNACKRDDPTGKCALTAVEQALEVPAAGGGVRWEVRPVGMPPGVTAVCDDGNPCTVGDLCAAGECKPQVFGCSCKSDSDCADDGDLCNGLPYCDKSDPLQAVCKTKPNSQVTCKSVDDTACAKNTCAPKTGACGLLPVPAGAPCDDGNPCTTSDYCVLGSCTGGAVVCVCQKDEDCKGKEDGNQCNGTLYCDKTVAAKPVCKVNPATIVSCPSQALAQCQQWTCNPTTGQCLLVAGDEGKPCDDDSPCTSGDLCAGGQCSGKEKSCDDGDACTLDTCGANGQCSHQTSQCSDGNSCTVDYCDKKSGSCSFSGLAANGKSCDGDGSGCTVNDRCDKGTCVTGKVVTCPDGQGACSAGVCASLGGFDFKCVTTAASDGTSCDDGDSCTVTATCQAGACKATGKEALYSVVLTPKLGVQGGLTAVADAGGGAVAAGWSAAPLAGPATWTSWWVTRVDAGGAPLWHAHLAGKPHVGAGVAGVRVTNTGQVLAVGSRVGVDGDLDAAAAGFAGGDGKLLWSSAVGEAKVDDGLVHAQPWPTGGFIAGGWRLSGGKRDGVVVRVSASGQVVWRTAVGKPGSQESVNDAAAASDGGALAVGWDEGYSAGKRLGLLVRVDTLGKLQWQQRVGDGSVQALRAVVALANGDILAAGEVSSGASPSRWLVRTSAAGVVGWSRVAKSVNSPRAMVRTKGGRVLIAGTAPSGSSMDLWLWATDGLGNHVWDGGYAGQGFDVGAAVWSDGAAVLAAGETYAQGRRGLLLRRNLWGHGSCSAAAGCESKAENACDDDKPCTIDSCSKGACTHQAAVGWACDADDGCSTSASCDQGACKVSAVGRLHATELAGASKSITAVTSVVPAADGSPHVGYLSGSGGTTGYASLRVDLSGKLSALVPQHGSVAKLTNLVGVIPLGDGSVVNAWRDASDKVYAARSRTTATGTQVLWTTPLCAPPAVTGCKSMTYTSCGVGKLFASADRSKVYWVSTSVAASKACNLPGYSGKYWATCRLVRTLTVASGKSSSAYSMCGNVYSGGAGKHGHTGTEWLTTMGGAGLHGGGFVTYGGGRVYKWHNKTKILTGNVAWLERQGGGYGWRRHYLSSTAHGAEILATAQAAGGLIVSGRRYWGATERLVLMRVNDAGHLMWSQETVESPWKNVRAIVPDAAGAILVGDRTTPSGRRPWMRSVDLGGGTVWEQTWTQLPKASWVVRNAWRVTNGDLVAGGYVADQGAVVPFTLRTSAWAHRTCAEAGACGKAPVCDDKQPCTADYCDGATGKCAAKPASGATCDDGDATTQGDVCKAGKCAGTKQTP